jgi:chromosome segregation ATPase
MYVVEKVGELRQVDHTSDRLAGLLERRAELEGELKVVSAPEASRAAAAASLAKAEAELATLDRSERAAWSDWAENPTVSEQPTPRHEERRALEQRRSLAAADLRGADAAVAAVQGRLNQLGAEMRQLGPQIYSCRLESVMSEVPEIERQIIDAHGQMHERLTRLRGLHTALAEEKAAASSRGDPASAILLQEAMTHLESLKEPPAASGYGEVLAHSAAWRGALR